MLFTELKIKEETYKLRLDARNSVSLERKLGKNPLEVLMETQTGAMPKIDSMIEIFAASLNKYQHGITIEKAYDIYDEFIEDGNTFTEFIPVILDIFKASGFFKEEDAEVTEIKN